MARLLGIDYGRRRIGLAVSDPTGTIAQGVDTILVSGILDAIKKLALTIKRYDTPQVVLGCPLSMNGSEGPAAQEVRAFGRKLAAETKVEVIEWDERLTSVAAKRSRRGLPLRKRRVKSEVDRTAATLLLQSYLDHQQHSD